MALSLVNYSSGGQQGGPFATVVSAAQNITAGNSIGVCLRLGSASGATSLTDTAGNVYTPLPILTTGSGDWWQYWYCNNCKGNASNIVTGALPASSNYTVIDVWQVANGPILIFDQAAQGNGSGTTLITATFSTSTADEIVLVTGLDTTTFATFAAAGSGVLDSASIAGGIAGAEHIIYTSTQTGVTASMTKNLASAWEIFAGVFKAAPNPSTISLIQSATHSNNNQASTVTPFSSNNIAHHFLAALVHVYNNGGGPGTITVTDTAGNTWVHAPGGLSGFGGFGTEQCWYVADCLAGPNTVTVSCASNPTSNYPTLQIFEYSGILLVSPFDTTSSASGTGTATNSGNITTTYYLDLLLGSEVNVTQTTAFVPAVGWMMRQNLTAELQVGPGTYAYTGTETPSVTWGANVWAFKAVAAPTPPSPASVNPTTGAQGSTISNFTVSGTNFDAGGTSTLSFSGTGITVNSYGTRNATTLVANISIAGNATLGARNVTITNASTLTGTLNSAFTVVVSGPPPNPIRLLPASGQQGQTLTVFSVIGTNFDPGGSSTISFSGTGITLNSYVSRNATTIVANITVASNALLGARSVTVTNPDTQTGTLLNSFMIVAPFTPDILVPLPFSKRMTSASAVFNCIFIASPQGVQKLISAGNISPLMGVRNFDPSGSGAGSTNVQLSNPINVQNHDTLVVLAGCPDLPTGSILSVTDNVGNVYTQGSPVLAEASGRFLQLWYAKNVIGSPVLVVKTTFSGTSTFTIQDIWDVSGADLVAPLEGFTGAALTGIPTGGPVTLTGISTINQNDLLLAGQFPNNLVGMWRTSSPGWVFDSTALPNSISGTYGGAEHKQVSGLLTSASLTIVDLGSVFDQVVILAAKIMPPSIVSVISNLQLAYAQLNSVYARLIHQDTGNNRLDLYAAINTAVSVVGSLNATVQALQGSGDAGIQLAGMQVVTYNALVALQNVQEDEFGTPPF